MRVFATRTLLPRIQAKMMSPPKKRTGGNDNNNNDKNKDDSNKARTYNIGMLQRMYVTNKKTITTSTLENAMVSRWGKSYKCVLTVENKCLAMRVFQDEVQDCDYKEMQLLIEILNAYNLGTQFIDYIKHDPNVSSPQFQSDILISLNIPTNSDRLVEWEL